ncbi:AAA family ATPase [Microbulbifer hainanensis]|uniref:AAA family ATPase n=1 Tax=Microbulbifer hainanensis TaxID=2735675 RepID=UPI001867B377|nr:AAA family ATPase [Microbulbifer hainanensis]
MEPRNNNKTSVFFSPRKPDDHTLFNEARAPAIVIVPSLRDWDDFGHKIYASYYLIRDNIYIQEGKILLGFIENDREIKKKLYKNEQLLISSEELPTFFTMRQDMEAYRALIHEKGTDRALQLLSELNDLVYARKSRKPQKWLSTALESEVFKLGFMRSSDQFFTFHNAESILDGVKAERLDRISTTLHLKFKLDAFNNDHQIDFEFSSDDPLPRRVNVLIGRNGLGKSQALGAIVKSLQYGNHDLIDPTYGRPMISRVLAIATPGETAHTFPEESATQKTLYRRLNLTRNTNNGPSRDFGEICVQLVRSTEQIGGNLRWEIFLKTISKVFKGQTIGLKLHSNVFARNANLISINGQNYVPLDSLSDGGEQATLELWSAIQSNSSPFKLISGQAYRLSSGELSFIKFAAQASLFIENGTLVLLDEPETHLHPNLISDFISLLNNLLEITGSIAIVASHSSYIVREIPKKQVQVFKSDSDGNIHILNPRLNTFGANIGSISYFIFEDEVSSIAVSDIANSLRNLVDRSAGMERLRQEVSPELFMQLQRELDQDHR